MENQQLHPDASRRKVLMLSRVFPPAGGPGVQRTTKFVRYLPQFGWSPVVWFGAAPADLPSDGSLLANIPADAQCRCFPHGDTSRWGMHVTDAFRRATNRMPWGDRIHGCLSWRMTNTVERFRRCLIPDTGILWAAASFLPLLSLVRTERPDALYSTYSPASNHLLAQWLHRRTGIPWVADFRDLWTDEGRYPYAHGPRWRKRLERHLEQRILEEADAVVGVTVSQTRILASRVPAQAGKFHTIPNGFDDADFPAPGENNQRDPRQFRLSHVGSLLEGRVSGALIDALNRASDALGRQSCELVLSWVGTASHSVRERLGRCRAKQIFLEYVDHKVALEIMAQADALLLLMQNMPNGDTIMAGKTLEYIASGVPILQVGQEGGEASRMLREMNAGVVVPADADRIHDAILDLRASRRAGTGAVRPQSERLLRFHRRNLTGELARVLNAIAWQRESSLLPRQRSRRPSRNPISRSPALSI